MHPEFASAVDPIFQAALRLESKIESNEHIVLTDERATLVRKIEEAEAKLGTSDEWIHSKYAICAWIDERLIVLPWDRKEVEKAWWKDNCLEKRFFNSWDAHEEFFIRASKAGSLSKKNAVEVFYLCVVLGFRGFYANSDSHYRNQQIQKLRLPDTIEAWCRETVKTLHLRHGRPIIPGAIQTGGSAKPLSGKRMLVLYAMLSTLLVAIASSCVGFVFLFRSAS